jgi:hypothetical protein
MNPTEFMQKMQADLDKAVAESRAAGRKKAAETRARNAKAKQEAKEVELKEIGRHIHPSDDPWTKKCRTLCGRIVPVEYALSSGQAKWATCDECKALLDAFRIFVSTKTLTYRRLNAWGTNIEVTEEEKTMEKTKRQISLERALVVLQEVATRRVPEKVKQEDGSEIEVMRRYVDEGTTDALGDYLIALINLEQKRLKNPEAPASTEMRRYHVSIAKLKVPVEVLQALRSV